MELPHIPIWVLPPFVGAAAGAVTYPIASAQAAPPDAMVISFTVATMAAAVFTFYPIPARLFAKMRGDGGS